MPYQIGINGVTYMGPILSVGSIQFLLYLLSRIKIMNFAYLDVIDALSVWYSRCDLSGTDLVSLICSVFGISSLYQHFTRMLSNVIQPVNPEKMNFQCLVWFDIQFLSNLGIIRISHEHRYCTLEIMGGVVFGQVHDFLTFPI